MFAIFFEHEQRPEGAYGEEDYAIEQSLGDIPGMENLSMQALSGSVMELPEGVRATSISPGRPNQNFDQFVKSLAHQIGGCLGIPSELLFLNFTASYSASRGALLEAWKTFKYWRQWFASEFCQSVYEEWLEEAAALGRIDAPLFYKDDYHAKLYAWTDWIGPSQGQLDPTKEVNAAVLRIGSNLSTYQRECMELTGEDWDLVMARRKQEDLLLPPPNDGSMSNSQTAARDNEESSTPTAGAGRNSSARTPGEESSTQNSDDDDEAGERED